RTGVTVVVPPDRHIPAGIAVLNGCGELTGAHGIREWGLLDTPVYLTSTHAVGRIFDGAVAVALAEEPGIGDTDDVVIPCVGECDDSWLGDPGVVHVEAAAAGRAVATAGADFAEGAVGAGTGMSCFDWKGGVGSASRRVGDATIGVLVLTNFGSWPWLRVDGVPVGHLLGDPHAGPGEPAGSCIVVVATDAPLPAPQLERVARRTGLGLARSGSSADHGSGEIFVAFSTSRECTYPDRALNPIFRATVDATEEAVLSSLWEAADTTGRQGR